MQNYRISLHDLPPGGKEFSLDDQAIWQQPLQEFEMQCRISKPLRARLTILPTDGGWLVRGTLAGEVVLPCNRCAEDAVVGLNAAFEDFEELPEQQEGIPLSEIGGADAAQPSESRIFYERNVPMLDLASICWEEFMLALPVNPLCGADCKGLCPQCGADLNAAPCSCAKDEGDPRLAVLRGLKLHKP